MIAMALCQRAEAADRRRADDGARRDRAGADPRAAGAAAARAGDGDRDRHARPRGGRRDGRRDRGHVRGPDRRERARRALFSAPEHPYTWGLLRSIPTLDGPREEQLEPIPGSPPSLLGAAVGLSLSPALPLRRSPSTRASSRGPGADRHLPARARATGRVPAAGGARDSWRSAAPVERQPADEPGGEPLLEVRIWSSSSRSRAGCCQRKVGAVRAVDGVELRRAPRARRSGSSASGLRARARPRG